MLSDQESMTDALVLASLRKAIASRQSPAGLIHHSDRGGQYASTDAANCYDNAFMESCFGTLKTERELTESEDGLEAARELSSDIPYDNRDGRHSSRGYQSPAEFEEQQTVPIQGVGLSAQPEAPHTLLGFPNPHPENRWRRPT
jgi:putative transposase